MKVAETRRLVIRLLDSSDAPFILELVNEPSWRRYIGDKGVTTLESAERYIADGPVAMYARLGFGLYVVQLKETGHPIGLCGLIKRDALDDVDLGFSFLSRFQGNGYAFESASAVMSYGADVLGLSRVVAIVSHDNARSGKLLEKLGFRVERLIRLHADGEALELHGAYPKPAADGFVKPRQTDGQAR